ncbi:MAG: iron transporter [Rhizobacter sp.]|nr:iron transporter [Rhizobacter sp.]
MKYQPIALAISLSLASLSGTARAQSGDVDAPAPATAAPATAASAAAATARTATEPASAPTAVLPAIVVTGSGGVARRIQDTPYAITVIDAADIRSAGPMVNLSEALSRVPGLTVNNRNNYAQDLQISSRGFGARSTFGVRGLRLYTDGIPASMPDGQGQVSHFDLASAERIEVLRGPFSALYGNAAGGVISLFSAAPKETRVEFGVDAGSFGQLQQRVMVESPFGNGWSIRAEESGFRFDGFRPHSEAQKHQANIRLGYQGEYDQFLFQLNRITQPAQDPLGLTRAQFAANPRQTTSQAIAFDTRKDLTQTQGGATWLHRFTELGPLHDMTVTAYRGTRSVEQWQSIPVATQAPPAHPGGVIDFDRDYYGADARLHWQWSSFGLVAGVSSEHESDGRRGYENFTGVGAAQQLGVTGRLRRDETDNVQTNDVYAQGDITLTDSLSATLGVRTGRVKYSTQDYYLSNGNDSGGTSYGYTNPVASLQWAARSDLNLYASAGRGFESPTLAELAYRPDGQTGLNTGLQPARSKQAEIGAKWRDDARRLGVDVAIFRADTDDEIGVATNTGGRSTYTNVGRTRREGAEAAFKWSITPQWRTQLALTTLKAHYLDNFNATTSTAGNRIAGTSGRSVFSELVWLPEGWRDTEVGLEWRGVGRTAVDDVNSDFAGGYGVGALRAGRVFDLGSGAHFSITGRIDNVTDRKYVGSVIVNDGNGRFFEPAAPRAYWIGVKFTQAWKS